MFDINFKKYSTKCFAGDSILSADIMLPEFGQSVYAVLKTIIIKCYCCFNQNICLTTLYEWSYV